MASGNRYGGGRGGRDTKGSHLSNVLRGMRQQRLPSDFPGETGMRFNERAAPHPESATEREPDELERAMGSCPLSPDSVRGRRGRRG